MKKVIVGAILGAAALLFSVTAFAGGRGLPEGPVGADNLVLSAPVNSWDEGLPLGNGLMGGLLWGGDSTVRVSLDRGDLWDERTHGEKEWWKKHNYKAGQERIAAKDFAAVHRWWDDPYNGVTPTKLPGGRLEISLGPGRKLKAFELDLATAEGFGRFTDGSELRAFFSAAAPVAMLSDSSGAMSWLDTVSLVMSSTVLERIATRMFESFSTLLTACMKVGRPPWVWAGVSRLTAYSRS